MTTLNKATRALPAYHAEGARGEGNRSATLFTYSIAEAVRSPNRVRANQIEQTTMMPLMVAPGVTINNDMVAIKSKAASHCTRPMRRNTVKKNRELRAPPTAKRQGLHQADTHPAADDISTGATDGL